jgi:hypothetical protein
VLARGRPRLPSLVAGVRRERAGNALRRPGGRGRLGSSGIQPPVKTGPSSSNQKKKEQTGEQGGAAARASLRRFGGRRCRPTAPGVPSNTCGLSTPPGAPRAGKHGAPGALSTSSPARQRAGGWRRSRKARSARGPGLGLARGLELLLKVWGMGERRRWLAAVVGSRPAREAGAAPRRSAATVQRRAGRRARRSAAMVRRSAPAVRPCRAALGHLHWPMPGLPGPMGVTPKGPPTRGDPKEAAHSEPPF